jgi:hypothetical protein
MKAMSRVGNRRAIWSSARSPRPTTGWRSVRRALSSATITANHGQRRHPHGRVLLPAQAGREMSRRCEMPRRPGKGEQSDRFFDGQAPVPRVPKHLAVASPSCEGSNPKKRIRATNRGPGSGDVDRLRRNGLRGATVGVASRLIRADGGRAPGAAQPSETYVFMERDVQPSRGVARGGAA